MDPMAFIDLTPRIAAVAPIAGVSVGVVGDKKTWRIDFLPAATGAERAAARAVVAAFDVAAEQTAAETRASRDRNAARLADILIAKGLITEDDLK
jgi:hypothetical protein